MQEVKAFYTIDEVFLSVNLMESNIQTILSCDRHSKAALKLLKKLIVLCSSLSISLIQFEMLEEALSLLKSADRADLELSKFGAFAQSWQGRLIIPSTLAFIYFQQKRFTDALKFLFQSQTMIQNTRESGLIVNEHMETLTNLLTFMILWKIGRFQDAFKYINAIPDEILETSRKNLYGIVTISKIAAFLKQKKDYISAIKKCEKTLSNTANSDISWDLVKKSLNGIYDEMQFKVNGNWLVTDEYITVFFVSNFVPLISQGTPVIRFHPDKRRKRNHSKKTIRPDETAVKTIPEPKKVKIRFDDLKNTRTLTPIKAKITSVPKEMVSDSPNFSSEYKFRAFSTGKNKLSYFSPRINSNSRPRSSKTSGVTKMYYAKSII